MSADERLLTIGVLAQKAAINTSRIRYYEEIGLLPQAVRTRSDQRVYTEADLKRLIFIKRCRDFGFSLKQVRELTSLSTSIKRDCAEVGTIASAHLDQIKSKIAELQELESALGHFVGECKAVCCGGPSRDCLVFEGISVSE